MMLYKLYNGGLQNIFLSPHHLTAYNSILYITMVSPTHSEEEGLPIPTNSSPSTNGRRRGSRVLQSSLEIAFSCKSGEVARLLLDVDPPRLLESCNRARTRYEPMIQI
jgi:hypothetical protein